MVTFFAGLFVLFVIGCYVHEYVTFGINKGKPLDGEGFY